MRNWWNCLFITLFLNKRVGARIRNIVSSKQSNFFSVRTKTNRNSICFGCFSVCFAKPKNIFFGLFQFISVFWTGIATTETNRILLKQTEKISKKHSLSGGPQNCNFFFSVRTETKSVSVVFWFAFSRNQKKFLGFVSMFRTGIETNRLYDMGN